MWKLYFIVLLYSSNLVASDFDNLIDEEAITQSKNFVFWPNATVPFYINSENFDHEQSMAIMTTLSMFAYKTCLKFAPVLVPPKTNQHVLVFENPTGIRQCNIAIGGHPVDSPHYISLGYNCIKQPTLNMIVMRALGFPFEHNRPIRDYYINVNKENIESSALSLFEKENILPEELRELPYDIHSVMHFSERDYTKNGHRTIMFKNDVTQKRQELSETDIRKIELIYGPECRKRDRQEKVELCQSFPGVRRKRDIDSNVGNTDAESQRQSQRKSLRLNPDITAPPNITDDVNPEQTTEQRIDPPDFPESIKELGIESEMQTLMEYVHKMSSVALKKARSKYCHDDTLKEAARSNQPVDALGVIEVVAQYTKSIVDDVVANLTLFCETSSSVDSYNKLRCYGCYLSTKHGPARWSTQHRPWLPISTNIEKHYTSRAYDKPKYFRSENNDNTEQVNDAQAQSAGTEEKYVGDAENVKDALRSRTTIKGENRSYYRKNERRRMLRKHTKLPYRDRGNAYADEGRYQQREKKSYRDKDTRHKVKNLYGAVGGFARPKKVQSKILSEESVQPMQEPQSKVFGEESLMKEPQTEEIGIVTEKNDYDNDDDTKAVYAEDQTLTHSAIVNTNEEKDKMYHSNENVKKIFPVPKTVALSKINQEFYDQRKWPNNVVPYIIRNEGTFDIEDIRSRLNAVNIILKQKTCASIEEISEQEARSLEDYLVLDSTPDYITGRVGGRQVVYFINCKPFM